MRLSYSSKEFEDKYTYEGNDLGAVYCKEKTVFKVWAPVADKVCLCLYKSGNADALDKTDEIEMEASINGVWCKEVSGDLNGTYYTFLVKNENEEIEACDPYAKTTGVNGNRAMVIDLLSTNPDGWEKDENPHKGERITDAIIYEAHVRDLTVEKGANIKNAGKFIGVSEENTKTDSGIRTGLSHMKELGITHLHLLPFYDYGSVDEADTEKAQYNWGYDPVNFNVPEGSYSTNPFDGAVRVKELKQMVKDLHDNGISVVMDVVYNHVFDAETFCFNKIVPGYFSRISETGKYSNGSGCGNDTASERSMVRKYIVDSVNYLADEYHIDGFRFDLVGLLDVDTINELVTTVKKKHPDTIFYGEGWTLPTELTKDNVSLATQANALLTPDFAYFNDTLRDGLKGSVFTYEAGFVSGNSNSKDAIEKCFYGLADWCPKPNQTINYASCHDNNTLMDRMALSIPGATRSELISMNKLAAVIYFTSQGVPFLQAGEEMLRTKIDENGNLVENSYASPDSVNAIRYSSLEEDATRKVYEYYKGLVAFRKAHPELRMESKEESLSKIRTLPVESGLNLGFVVDENTIVFLNASKEEKNFNLPSGNWAVYIDSETSGTLPLRKAKHSVSVAPVSAMVLCKEQ